MVRIFKLFKLKLHACMYNHVYTYILCQLTFSYAMLNRFTDPEAKIFCFAATISSNIFIDI